MKLKIIVLIVVAGLGIACGHHPAYQDINTNQPAKAEPQSSGAPGAPEASAGAPAGQAAAPTQAPAFRAPAFMDKAKGYPKDLPIYPAATIINVQYGPRENIDVYSVAMQTHDPMDKITAFYDKLVKSNGWTVANRTIDPEYSEWMLKKADDDEAKITVQKDQKAPRFIIVAARTSKPSPPAAKPQS
jgi:hypothetical protein